MLIALTTPFSYVYDTGGDIVEDLGTLEYLKQRIIRAHFGDEPE